MTAIFIAVFKFNTVFVIDSGKQKLFDIGFGARSIKSSNNHYELVLSDDEVIYCNNYL
jgi:hypothetical protein